MRTPLKAPRQPLSNGARRIRPREGDVSRKRKLWLECSPEDEPVGGSQPSAMSSDGFNNGLH